MELVGFILDGVVARCRTKLTQFFLCGSACRSFCKSQDKDVMISSDEIDDGRGKEDLKAGEIAVVLARLGIGCGDGGGDGRRVVGELLEDKEASEWELKEAFYVFDRNEDGFITADELWNVMRRLGFEEGRRVEDCKRMIKVFDEDGDGKISFFEFKRLLENTI